MAPLKKDDVDKAKKQSVSFPPDLWEYIEGKAGRYGKISPIVQEAVRRMKEEEEGASAPPSANNGKKKKSA